MTSYRNIFFAAVLALLFQAAAPAQTGFPFQDESLRYSVNWPSGLSLGEAALSAKRSGASWQFEMSVNTSVPGFAVADKFHATAAVEQLCSSQFERDLSQGSRATREQTEFDQAKGSAVRTTVSPSGGRSTFDIPGCARDALSFLYFTRRELGQGRVPGPQQVYYGGAYTVRMDYMGETSVPVNEKPTVADRVSITVKGSKTSTTFDAYFARDAARTPLLVKVPLTVGSLTLELAR